MATSKKTTPANKHKAAAPKKLAAKPSASTGRAMDIIPKNRVRPTTTSRPVITTSTPAVADNTMTSPSGAPTLQVKRRQITISPPQGSELNKDDVLPNLAVGAPEAAAAPADADPAPASTSAEGVSVSDLIAKRKEKVLGSADKPTANADGTASVAAESAAETEAYADASQTPGTTPELPATESSVDDPAAAEAARLLSDATADTNGSVTEVPGVPPAEKTVVSDPVETDAATATTPEPETPVQDSPAEKTAVTEGEEAAPATAPQPAAPEAATPADSPKPTEATAAGSDSVGEILKEELSEPQEHSQALKDEIKSMDDKSGQSESHHDPYGGQPVIVVHKERGPMSAVAWALWFFLCLGIAVLIVNFLLDAGFIETTYRIPHTNIL